MAFVQVNVRFTEEEKAVLSRRAEKEGISETEHLRTCVLLEAFLAADAGAVRLMGRRLRVKLAERLMAGTRFEVV